VDGTVTICERLQKYLHRCKHLITYFKKGETIEHVNMGVLDIEVDIGFQKFNFFWNVSVLNGIIKILRNYQIKANTCSKIIKPVKTRVEKFYEYNSYTYEMAYRGNFYFLPLDMNRQQAPPLYGIDKSENDNDIDQENVKKIFIFFNHELIEKKFHEWTKWLTSAVQLSKLDEGGCKIYLIDHDMYNPNQVMRNV
jgi:hypothetical protein